MGIDGCLWTLQRAVIVWRGAALFGNIKLKRTHLELLRRLLATLHLLRIIASRWTRRGQADLLVLSLYSLLLVCDRKQVHVVVTAVLHCDL